jgi:hypothetical protein
MRTTDTGLTCPWVLGGGLFFTMTLTLVVHSSTAVIFSDTKQRNITHPLLDTADIAALVLHSVAYYIACFATTVFLLFCAAIILVLATMCMELSAEGFYILSCMVRSWRLRRERGSQPIPEKAYEDTDTYCDSWNYR